MSKFAEVEPSRFSHLRRALCRYCLPRVSLEPELLLWASQSRVDLARQLLLLYHHLTVFLILLHAGSEGILADLETAETRMR